MYDSLLMLEKMIRQAAKETNRKRKRTIMTTKCTNPTTTTNPTHSPVPSQPSTSSSQLTSKEEIEKVPNSTIVTHPELLQDNDRTGNNVTVITSSLSER